MGAVRPGRNLEAIVRAAGPGGGSAQPLCFPPSLLRQEGDAALPAPAAIGKHGVTLPRKKRLCREDRGAVTAAPAAPARREVRVGRESLWRVLGFLTQHGAMRSFSTLRPTTHAQSLNFSALTKKQAAICPPPCLPCAGLAGRIPSVPSHSLSGGKFFLNLPGTDHWCRPL